MNHGAPQFPDALVEALRHERLIPFVGPQITRMARNLDGQALLPDWSRLFTAAAEQMAKTKREGEERLLRELISKRHPDWYQAALTARSAMPGTIWQRFLYEQMQVDHERLDGASISTARAIWALGSPLVITTAIDRVLSWACPRAADLSRWILAPPEFVEDLASFPQRGPVLWHMHGFIDDPANLVLTPRGRMLHPEASGALRCYRSALSALQTLLVSHSVLFLGFGDQDPYFIHLLRQVNELFHQCGGPHFALTTAKDANLLASRIGDLPVSLITMPYTDEVALAVLAERSNQPSLAVAQEEITLAQGNITQMPTLAVQSATTVNTDEGVELPIRYQIREKIGQGGMGVVYLAYDRQLDREVAVKVIQPTLMSKAADQQFGVEARAIAKLDHPSIVPVYDYGRHNGTVYLTMPMVRGKLLRKLMRASDITLFQKLEICAQLAEALDYSHIQGVYHCDIKPENVMVRKEGEGYRVRVMDFGLAQLASRKRMLHRGDVLGTPAYLSPEQCTASDVDGRADLYALGTILYELLAGETPFKGPFHSLIYKIVHERPPLLLSRGVDIDEELESLVLGCLAKKPENRPQRGQQLAVALRTYLERRHGRTSGVTHQPISATYLDGPPLVGREEEMNELSLRLDACLAGVCQFAVIGAESGLGKTRLMQELEKRAQENAEPFQVWWGRFPEHEESMPYQVFSDLVSNYFRNRPERDTPLPDLSDLAPELVRFLPALSEIAPIRDAAGPPSRPGSGEVRDQRFVFDLMARTIRRLVGDSPTLLLLENLSAGGGSLEALQYLVHRMADTPTFIVGSYRGGQAKNHPLNRFLRTFQGDRRFLSLQLGPLDETRHRRLVTSLLGGGEASPDLLDKLFATSEGNPYFSMELVRSLRESGGITTNEQGFWVLSDDAVLHDDALPRTIQGAVEERIKHLPDPVRDTLATAAILGRRFTFSDLEALDANPSTLDAALDLLIYDGILAEDPRSRGSSFSFQSRVVRDVLYQRFSRRKRRNLHRRYALYLERTYSGKLERVYASLVHHFAEGDDPDKTVDYAIKQARRSLEAFAPEEAIRCVQLALGFVRDESYEGGALIEGRLCLLLSEAQLGMGNLELALGEAAEAVRAFKKGNDAKGAATAALLAAETAWRLHKVETTRRWVENGIALARTIEDSDVLYRLLTLAAKEANLSRNYSKAREFLGEADTMAPSAQREALSGPIPFGGKLRTATIRPITSLQPGKIQTVEELEYSANIFEPLVQVEADGNLVPLLAERWECLNLGRHFRFHLRASAAFSDGESLTADHVKQAFERSASSMVGSQASAFSVIEGFEALRASQASSLSGIVVEDNLRLSIYLTTQLPIYPALLSDHANTAIFKPAKETGHAQWIGTGPYILAHLDASGLELVRNTHYWRKTLPSLEIIDCRILADEQAMVDAMRTDQVDLGRDLSTEQIETMVRLPRYQRGLVECTRKSVGFLVFNQHSPQMQNQALRSALVSMVRVRELVWHTLGRCARPATCLIPPGIIGHDPARRSQSRQRGGEAQQLKELGLSLPLVIRAAVHPYVTERYGPLIQGMFREWMTLGIEVQLRSPSREIFASHDGPPKDIDLLVTRHRGLFDDPDAFTFPYFHSSGSYGSYCGSPQRDALLEEARTRDKRDERSQLYRRLELQLLEEALVLPLFYDIDCRLASTRLKNVGLSPTAPFINYMAMGKVGTREPILPKGIVRVPIPIRLEHLDPAHMPSYDYAEVVPNIFETLTRVGAGAHVEPWLAVFHTEDGGRRYHFQLREHVYFHDGRSLTARDVRYSFERILRESVLHAGLLRGVQGAEAFRRGKAREIAGLRLISETKFTIDLDKPLSFFPGILSHPALAILPDGAVPVGEICSTYVGTGPFRLTRFEQGSLVTLNANYQYWHKGLPRCNQLEFHLGMSPTAVAKAFREGQLSMAAGMFPAEAESLRSLGGYRQEVPGAPGLSTYFLLFNTRSGVFADREARRTLIRALDVPALVRESLAGLCLEAGGFIPPGLAGREARQREYDEDNAQTLPPGITAHIALHPFFARQFVVFWERMTHEMSRLGISLKPVHREVIPDLAALPHIDLVAYRWFADYPDADTFVKLLHSQDGLFGSMVGSARIDMLVEKARIETDENLRGEIYAEIEAIIAREALMLPLFHETNYRLARPELRGLNTRIGFPIVTYETLSIEESGE